MRTKEGVFVICHIPVVLEVAKDRAESIARRLGHDAAGIFLGSSEELGVNRRATSLSRHTHAYRSGCRRRQPRRPSRWSSWRQSCRCLRQRWRPWRTSTRRPPSAKSARARGRARAGDPSSPASQRGTIRLPQGPREGRECPQRRAPASLLRLCKSKERSECGMSACQRDATTARAHKSTRDA